MNLSMEKNATSVWLTALWWLVKDPRCAGRDLSVTLAMMLLLLEKALMQMDVLITALSWNRSDITQQAPGQRQHLGQTQTLPVILERISVVNQICQSQHLCCLFIGFTVILYLKTDWLWVVFCLNTLKIGIADL